MKVAEFRYELPEELIAQTPIEKRDESRLMILNKEKRSIEHKKFKNIIEYLEPGDVLVRNNTKVIPARLYGKKETGAKVEFLLLNNIKEDIWECIVRPWKQIACGNKSNIQTRGSRSKNFRNNARRDKESKIQISRDI